MAGFDLSTEGSPVRRAWRSWATTVLLPRGAPVRSGSVRILMLRFRTRLFPRPVVWSFRGRGLPWPRLLAAVLSLPSIWQMRLRFLRPRGLGCRLPFLWRPGLAGPLRALSISRFAACGSPVPGSLGRCRASGVRQMPTSDVSRPGFFPVRVSLNITEQDSEALDRLAVRTGESRAALARVAFQSGLTLIDDMYRQRRRRAVPGSPVDSESAEGSSVRSS